MTYFLHIIFLGYSIGAGIGSATFAERTKISNTIAKLTGQECPGMNYSYLNSINVTDQLNSLDYPPPPCFGLGENKGGIIPNIFKPSKICWFLEVSGKQKISIFQIGRKQRGIIQEGEIIKGIQLIPNNYPGNVCSGKNTSLFKFPARFSWKKRSGSATRHTPVTAGRSMAGLCQWWGTGWIGR